MTNPDRDRRDRIPTSALFDVNGLSVWTANTAGFLDNSSFSDGPLIQHVFAVDSGGELVRCAWSTKSTGHDEQDYAHVTVVVTLPGGMPATFTWRSDGRV